MTDNVERAAVLSAVELERDRQKRLRDERERLIAEAENG